MSIMKYTKDHEWIRLDGNTGLVGITTYAQSQLGDVVFVELPQIGQQIAKGREAAVVESVKAASEVYAPASGQVIEINGSLEGTPATVNEDAEGRGWFLKMQLLDLKELDDLMNEDEYKRYVETLS